MTEPISSDQQNLLEWLQAMEVMLDKAAGLLELASGDRQERDALRIAVARAQRHVKRLRYPS